MRFSYITFTHACVSRNRPTHEIENDDASRNFWEPLRLRISLPRFHQLLRDLRSLRVS